MRKEDFIAQIVAAPDDDAPRLVYADWLTSIGDPLGELIAVQCALARAERDDGDPREIRRLAKRMKELAPNSASMRRGMTEVVVVDNLDAIANAAAFLADWPLARGLIVRRLQGGSEGVRALAATPWRERLRELAVANAVAYTDETEAAIRELVDLPCPLTSLTLEFDGRLVHRPISAWLLPRIAACDAHRGLRHLVIRQCRHLGQTLDALGSLRDLTELTLENADLDHDEILAGVNVLPKLSALDLSDNYSRHQACDLDVPALLAVLPELKHLRLAKLGLGDAHALAVAEAPSSVRLTRLDLARNEIGDAGALALAHSPHLRGLRRLNLNANRLSADVKTTLKTAFPQAEVQVR